MRARIAKRLVDGLKTRPGAEYVVWDTALPGFGVRVRASGRKVYLIKFGTGRRGSSRWLTIGRHGGPWTDLNGRACSLTAELARKEATRLLGEKVKGADPAAKRDREKAFPTLKEFASRYLVEHAEPHKKAKSVREDRRNLERIILPALGRNRIDRVTHADVTRFHLSLKQTPTLANRCLALLSHMFSKAEAWGVGPDGLNPCRHVQRFPESKRKRYLSSIELSRLAQALTQEEPEHPFEVAAIRLLLFTGARVSEVTALRWTDVDLEHRELQLVDSKTGAKTIYLNAPALEVLSGLPRLAGNPHVFPGRRTGAHLAGLAHVWEPVRERAGLEDVRLHDLRHSFASVAVSGGASLALIGGLLGHTNPATTQRYAHLSADPLRDVAERAGEVIASAMGQKRSKAVENA